MSILTRLFRQTKRPGITCKRIEPVVDEDAGYADHLVGQKTGPFYCGTAFCGHFTKKAARECWARKCAALKTINEEAAKILAAEGEAKYWEFIRTATIPYYPEQNPANWPCNRSSAEMRAEFIERAKIESQS